MHLINPFRSLAIAAVIVTLAGCASEPVVVRSTRPEAIIVKQDVTWGPEGSFANPFRRRVTLPAGVYHYAWEDKNVWYYENPDRKIIVDAGKNRVREAHGAIEMSKRYDHYFISQYVSDGDVRNDGAGELVVMMLPKKDGKRVDPEGAIPSEGRQQMEFRGEVPIGRE